MFYKVTALDVLLFDKVVLFFDKVSSKVTRNKPKDCINSIECLYRPIMVFTCMTVLDRTIPQL